MFTLRAPTDDDVRRLLERARRGPLSYDARWIGATLRGEHPPAFFSDRASAVVGRGVEAFRRAAGAIRAWRMFDGGWTKLHDPSTPIVVGEQVAIIIPTLGVHAVAVSRVVHVVDEPRRFGFAYGTTLEHMECGEELFLVEHRPNDEVVYELTAFSRPEHPLLWLGLPFTRTQQARFRRLSVEAMKAASLPPGGRSVNGLTA